MSRADSPVEQHPARRHDLVYKVEVTDIARQDCVTVFQCVQVDRGVVQRSDLLPALETAKPEDQPGKDAASKMTPALIASSRRCRGISSIIPGVPRGARACAGVGGRGGRNCAPIRRGRRTCALRSGPAVDFLPRAASFPPERQSRRTYRAGAAVPASRRPPRSPDRHRSGAVATG
jgi:hypothetical protein